MPKTSTSEKFASLWLCKNIPSLSQDLINTVINTIMLLK